MSKKIIIYTDGGCRANGKENNVGSHACILSFGEHVKEYSQAESNTTNNIQELKGVISALKMLKTDKYPVEVYTDSKYVVEGCNTWVANWKKNGWRTSNKKSPVKNVELWIELDSLLTSMPNVEVLKVKGHADSELNNRADLLVNIAMDKHIA